MSCHSHLCCYQLEIYYQETLSCLTFSSGHHLSPHHIMIQVLVCGAILPFTLFNTGSLFGLLALKFVQALVVCSAFIQKDPKQTFPYLTGPEHPKIELSDGQQDIIMTLNDPDLNPTFILHKCVSLFPSDHCPPNSFRPAFSFEYLPGHMLDVIFIDFRWILNIARSCPGGTTFPKRRADVLPRSPTGIGCVPKDGLSCIRGVPHILPFPNAHLTF